MSPNLDSPTPSRATNGQFARGNSGGPGNPFGRRLASMRQAILVAVSDEDITQIMKSMTDLAKSGNIQAAKLVLHYAVGKPAPAPEPDRVDIDEWNLEKEKSIPAPDVVAAIEGMPVATANLTATASIPSRNRMFADMLAAPAENPDDLSDISIEDERKAMQAAEERFAAQYAAGQIDPYFAPSPNGFNGRPVG